MSVKESLEYKKSV